MQRSGADVVDAAVGQLIDESDQGLGLSRQSHDRFVAQQARASRGSISLWPMCTPSTLMPLRRACHTTSARSSITKATESDFSLSSMICAMSRAISVSSEASAPLARN